MASFRERYLDSEYLHSIRMRPELSELMNRFKFKSVSLIPNSPDMRLEFEVDPNHLDVPSVPQLIQIMAQEWKWSSLPSDHEITIKLHSSSKPPKFNQSQSNHIPIMPIITHDKNKIYPVSLWFQHTIDLNSKKSNCLTGVSLAHPSVSVAKIESLLPVTVTLNREPWVGVQLLDPPLSDLGIMWKGHLYQLKDQVNLILNYAANLKFKVLRPEVINLDYIQDLQWDIYDETSVIDVLGNLILVDRRDQPPGSRGWWDQHNLPNLIPLGLIHVQRNHHLEVTDISSIAVQFDLNTDEEITIVGLVHKPKKPSGH